MNLTSFLYLFHYFMKIYIKTPLIGRRKAIPHMLEHCIAKSHFWSSDFFTFTYGSEVEISSNFTLYEYDKWVSIDSILKYLTDPISKKAFEYELPIIQEECEDSSYDQRIYQESLTLLLKKKFDLNSASDLSREAVKKYHEKYYQLENFLICDDTLSEYKLLFQGEKLKKLRNWVTTSLQVSPFLFEDDAYFIYWKQYCLQEDYWKLFFLQTLLEGYIFYQKRWQWREYYHGTPYFFTYQEANWLVVPDYDFSNYSQDFFLQGKQYLLSMLKAWYFSTVLFLNNYFYWIPATRDEVIALCESFSWNHFQKEILTPLNEMKKGV